MLVKRKSFVRLVAVIAAFALTLTGCTSGAEAALSSATPPPTEESAPSAEAPPPSEESAPSEEAPPPTEESAPTEEEAATTGESSSNERIGFITQEYIGDNIAEIPYFEYDGEMNPELDAINRLLNQGLQFRYEEFLENKSEQEWIEIKTYPFTSKSYLQVVITNCVFPNYGTDGEIESINYDRNTKRWLTNDDALAMMGLSEDDVLQGVGEHFEPKSPGEVIDAVDIAGFLIREFPDNEDVLLLLNIRVKNPEADEPWQGFYTYSPDGYDLTNDLTKQNNECLFDPYEMDQMDPPLSYQIGMDSY